MAGTRLGTLYTENRDLVEAMAQLGSFHGISGTTQHQVAQLLKDRGKARQSHEHNPLSSQKLSSVDLKMSPLELFWMQACQ